MKTLMPALLAVLLSVPAVASSRSDEVADALKQAKAAADEADDASGACRKKVAPRIEDLIGKLRDLKTEASDKQLKRAKDQAEDAADLAKDTCGSAGKRVSKPLEKVVASLDAALAATASDATPTSAPAGQQGGGGILGINVNFAGGLGGLLGGGGSSTSSSSSSHKATKRVEEINGRSVDDDDDAAPAPKQAPASDKAAFGATCNRNSDCSSNSCFVGTGNLGYCTKMCNSWSDCPSFWECTKAGNAPQRICMQDKD